MTLVRRPSTSTSRIVSTPFTPDVVPGFRRMEGDVRGDDQPALQPVLPRTIGAQQAGDRVPRRLLRDHVEAGAGDVAVAQAALQRIDVEDRAARGVHHHGVARQQPQLRARRSARGCCGSAGNGSRARRTAPAAPPGCAPAGCPARGPSHSAGWGRRTPPCSRRLWPEAPPPSRCGRGRGCRRSAPPAAAPAARARTAQGAGSGPRWVSWYRISPRRSDSASSTANSATSCVP